jgi:hypothetical protein
MLVHLPSTLRFNKAQIPIAIDHVAKLDDATTRDITRRSGHSPLGNGGKNQIMRPQVLHLDYCTYPISMATDHLTRWTTTPLVK